jgi:transposase
MTKMRREFTPEFKREVVALLESSGRPLMQIATELGISPSMLRSWRSVVHDGIPQSRAGSKVPTTNSEIAQLRAYLRQRERLLEYAASHIIQHMQKVLTEMNLQLHHVVSDITGATGLRIIRAILAGERDPVILASLWGAGVTPPALRTIEQALTGHYRAEHLFTLEQALALYDTYQHNVAACDQRIEAILKALSPHKPDPGLLPASRRRMSHQPNEPSFDLRGALYAVLGQDLTRIYGLGYSLALNLVAECGTDVAASPSAKHFTFWLCLAPSNKISGGKVLSSRTRRSGSRAEALLRLAGSDSWKDRDCIRLCAAGGRC